MRSHPLGNGSSLVFNGGKLCSLAFGTFFIHPSSTYHVLTHHMQDELVLS